MPRDQRVLPAGNTDRALVLAARHGDRDAFATLFDRHQPLLVALCRRMLGRNALVEDAVQEAALQALLSLKELRRPERFGPWLGGIGLNVCRRLLRDRSRDAWSWEALAGGWRLREPVAWQADPAARAVSADVSSCVRRAVAGLPPGQRGAVLLVYFAGLTHGEAAAQLGIEVGAVKTRVHKARATLRRRLASVWKEEVMPDRDFAQPTKRRVSRRRLLAATGATGGALALGATYGGTGAGTSTAPPGAVPVRVADVRSRLSEGDRPELYLVMLEEVGGDRRLPIWIGQFEAVAMAAQLENVRAPRPLTYRFAASVLEAAGARLREVQISRLAGDTFYAIAVVESPNGTIARVDARPSDALNLALAAGAPIHVSADLFRSSAEQPSASFVHTWYDEGSHGAAEIVARNEPAPLSAPGGSV